jgi:hypothetical protein
LSERESLLELLTLRLGRTASRQQPVRVLVRDAEPTGQSVTDNTFRRTSARQTVTSV